MPLRDEQKTGADAEPDREESEEIFRRFFETYYRPVASFFASRGVSAEISEELTQDTFLRVYRGLPYFRHEANVETWLFRIARNVWLNSVRSHAASKRRAEEVPLKGLVSLPSADPSPLHETLSRERSEQLNLAIAQLPTKMRRCVLLRLQGWRPGDIAAVLQISPETVKTHLQRGQYKLGQSLLESDS